ncbi:VPS9A [Symbiodinium natans]|uniref:VPS9A protein n=1 Tax=Symbiodinium natans TaxID=878477 RepID=A0A812NXV3_9DINO|nr:VPS9A [Symbiodinium natans]
MPVAEGWIQLQREVWELDAENAGLDADIEASLRRLATLRRREAELLFGLRALRREASHAASATAAWPPTFSASAVELEAVLGRGLANAWAELVTALVPERLGDLARTLQRPSREVLGHMASALCAPSAPALEMLLAAEVKALPAGANVAASFLAEGSFCGALLPALTIDAPEVEAWLREALSGEAMDAVASLLSAERLRRPRSTRRVSKAWSLQESAASSRRSSKLSQLPESPELPPRISIATFIGEAVPELPTSPKAAATAAESLPSRREVELADQSDSPGQVKDKRDNADSRISGRPAVDVGTVADALVRSLVAATEAAPPSLCRVAAALEACLAERSKDVLGVLLISNWLAPALLTPSLGLGLGLANATLPLLNANENGARALLISLAKLLKAAAQPSLSADAEGDAHSRAQLLREDLFEPLIRRGRRLLEEAQPNSEVELPCCVVCRTADIITLGCSLAAAADAAAEVLQVDVDLIAALGRRPTSGSASPGTTVLWLRRGKLSRPKRPPRQPQEAEDRARFESFEGSLSRPRQPRGEEQRQSALLLLRQLLSEPKTLCGTMAGTSAEGSLRAALRAARRKGGTCKGEELSRQLKIELLEEALQDPAAASSSSSTTPHATPVSEEELFQSLQEELDQGRAAQTGRRRTAVRLQVARRLDSERCSEVSRCLRCVAEAAWSLRFGVCLAALWAPAERGGGSPALPELCVFGPLSRAPPSAARPGERRRSVFFGNLMKDDTASESALPAAVRVVRRTYCPFHRMAAVGASIGVEGLANDTSMRHYAVKSLRDVVVALQRMPIHGALVDDPLGVAPALEELVALIVEVIAAQCKLSQFQGAAQGFQVTEDEEEWAQPCKLIQGDELHLSDCVSRFLFNQLHFRLFPSEPTVNDMRLRAQISRFAWLRPRHLDLPRSLSDTEQAAEAVSQLRRLHELRSPAEILAALARAFRVVTEAACLKSQLTAALDGGMLGKARSEDDAFGADEALPLFILIMVRANPPMMASVLSYAERFTARQQLRTEQGYALAQAQAAVSFAATLQRQALSNLSPGEWERHIEGEDVNTES